MLLKSKAEVKPSTCIVPCMVYKPGMDYTVLPAINTIPALNLVSVHQMALPPIEVANI